jgi:hypothetical protein
MVSQAPDSKENVMEPRHMFWDVVEGRRPHGPDAHILGARIVEAVPSKLFQSMRLPTSAYLPTIDVEYWRLWAGLQAEEQAMASS